ncbi:Glycosyl transferase [Rubripirellula obstinata]|uniref:Lipid-A-disaccharide synthase n=1 Tax=Rubripirellula obstinata TaxID=406547 RepID=A0A5B1CNA5_9BACT|nr:lipid-A-disaccharide synthase [Rubripirellula obstinata]KAA1260843.1 Glycosyl transferase [Rubripirellula obstinata]
MGKRIFFSVGEPSGDQHAARFITELAKIDPSIEMVGFGGPEMQRAGCRIDLDLTQHAVVGLLEVLPKIRQFFGFADQAEAVFAKGDIDAVVLVDFPGFNWHIAKRAKRYGIPVHYYCPPQLWAWAPWRIRKMRRSVDHVWSVLPFEHQYFQERGLNSTYIGHPFFDSVAETKLDSQLMTEFSKATDDGSPIVAVLPGSRGHEVRGNFPIMLQAIRRLHQRYPNARFAVAACRDTQGLWCRDQLTVDDQALPIDFYVGKTSEIIEAAQCAMMVSGSVSLELMARRTPAAVIYRVGRFLHTVGSRLIQVDSLTLPNLIAGRKIFPEFVSVGATDPAVDFLTESIDSMLGDQFYFHSLLRDLDRLRSDFAAPGASAKLAQAIFQKLEPGSAGSNFAGPSSEGPSFAGRRAA